MGKRVLSGIQASGIPTLGNYLGALKIWAANQDKYDDNFYFVPDLHTLNNRPAADQLKANSYSTVAALLAAGIDPERSVIFNQSSVSAHSELFSLLNNFVTMGELSRQTQYKEKKTKKGELVGLFVYPVLMAADILLYDTDVVPVGEDQLQHVELARDIAERFNNIYGAIFKLPQAVVPEVAARVMDLQDPTRKMSKSESSLGFVLITDTDEEIRDKFKRAVTDSGSEISSDKDKKPGITNLLNIMAACTGRSVAQLEADYKSKSYREFKSEVAEAVVASLAPVRERYNQLADDTAKLEAILKAGKLKADKLAKAKLQEVKEKIGLITL